MVFSEGTALAKCDETSRMPETIIEWEYFNVMDMLITAPLMSHKRKFVL
ncbi:MAG: hypothetical protein JJV99_12220 [Colwellia sp.]|nr:hypothetical protein [Colwellia sp.]